MDKYRFISLIQNSTLLKANSDDLFDSLIKSHPYCQLTYILKAKQLFEQGSIDAQTAINSASLRSLDRKQLRKYLYSTVILTNEEYTSELINLEEKNENEIKNEKTIEEKEELEVIQDINLEIIPSYKEKLEELRKHAINIHNEILEERKKEKDTKSNEIFPNHESGEHVFSSRTGEEHDSTIENKDADLLVNYLESLEKQKTKNVENKIDINYYIDKFIQQEPRLSRPKPILNDEETEIEDLAKGSSIPDVSIISENLALIYYKQKKYLKAIDIYNKLCLKYPEKSVYFANQIKEIEKISKN